MGLIVSMGADGRKPKPKVDRSDGRAAVREKPGKKEREK